MLMRRSVQSVLRTPFKSLLFFILIAAVTLLLCLGISVWASSTRMLQNCRESYRTIGVLEYLGPEYPDTGRLSDDDRTAMADIDLTELSKSENVLFIQPEKRQQCHVPGYRQSKFKAPYGCYAVLEVSRCFYVEANNFWQCIVSSAPYSYDDITGNTMYIIAEGTGFKPEADKRYIVTGVFSDNQHFTLTPPSDEIALAADIPQTLPCFAEVTDGFLTGEGAVYQRLAEVYSRKNSSVSTIRMYDPLDNYLFHEQFVSLLSGRLLTPEDSLADAQVCVISENIANVCLLSLGDELCIDPDTTSEQRYTIIGIASFDSDTATNVYLPDPAPEQREQLGNSYTVATFRLENGSATAFEHETAALCGEQLRLTTYDQGFAERAASLNSLQQISLLISFIAVLAALTVLFLFAHLFVGKQRQTVDTMLCMGTGKARTRLYLLTGAGLIAFVATLSGALTSFFLSGRVLTLITEKVAGTSYQDIRYSSKTCKATLQALPLQTESLWLFIAVAAVAFLAALTMCVVSSNSAFRPRRSGRQQDAKLPPPPKQSASLSGGFLKYALLSVRRGRIRSLLTPCACLIMAVFSCSLVQSSLSYLQAEDTLYDSTRLTGQFVDIHGRQGRDLVIRSNVFEVIAESPYLQDIACSISQPYLYYDRVPLDENGFPKDFTPMCIKSYFSLETTIGTMSGAAKLVYTNAPDKTQEFNSFSGMSVEYMDGWDASMFQNGSSDILPCVVTQRFLDKHSLQIGDSIRVYMRTYADNNIATLTPVQPVIVGVFKPISGLDNIYIPLPYQTYKQISYQDMPYPSYLDEPIPNNKLSTIVLHSTTDAAWLLSQQDTTFNTMSFSVSDARMLPVIKDGWEQASLSYPGHVTRVRNFVVFDDSEFLDSLDSIKRNSLYFDVLSFILFVLIALVGVIVASLMVNSRRGELVVMRSLGTSRIRVFLNLFFEQFILCVLGTGVAALLWGLLFGLSAPYLPYLPLFALSCCIGSALSIMRLNRRRILAVLSERE